MLLIPKEKIVATPTEDMTKPERYRKIKNELTGIVEEEVERVKWVAEDVRERIELKTRKEVFVEFMKARKKSSQRSSRIWNSSSAKIFYRSCNAPHGKEDRKKLKFGIITIPQRG